MEVVQLLGVDFSVIYFHVNLRQPELEFIGVRTAS